MRKAIFIVAALVLVLSGVAAVSAYEAHVINVRAHVENAMSVNRYNVDFGTVFPEEWVIEEFIVSTSNSFCADDQLRVTYIEYEIWVEWKPNPAGGYYPWLGDCLYIGIDAVNKWPSTVVGNPGDLVPVGPVLPPGPPGAIKVLAAPLPLHKLAPYNLNDIITIGLDTPVFEGYYNKYTDPIPKPSGLDAPTVIILKTDTDRYFPEGVTLGVDIKIQITDIY
jgi:hypothetical protein